MSSLPETGFIRIEEVLKYIPVGKTSWLNGVKSGIYPKPVKLGGRTIAWRAEDIHAFIASFAESK